MAPDAEQNRDCPTNIVTDSPATDDAFGTHEALARVLAGIVDQEEGGKSIGLAGSWGVGKSTVIQQLKKMFSARKDRAVWVFDAWAHEGDPLRRSFLESLIGFLSNSDRIWVDAKKWNKKKEDLARRRRKEYKQTSPYLTPAGWTGAIFALLIPIGAVLFAEGLRAGPTITLGGDPHWPTVVGLLLMTGPLWIAPIIFLVLNGLAKYEAYQESRPFEWLSWSEALSPVTQQQITRTRTQIMESPDPTSIEFEGTFNALIRDALQDNERRLVLVIDNLDRVDARDALRIWSTLQTFLHQESQSLSWTKRVWVIMPYDPVSIRRLWDEQDRSELDDMPRDDGSPNPLATAFLDKTFQIRLEVPTPVPSDWRDYLYEHLKEALPEHDIEEFHVVYRLFKLLRVQRGTAPTPREIKILVNQIGALHRQQGDTFDLSHLAYYVLLSRSGVNIIPALLTGDVPGDNERGLLGDTIEEDLAALAFGTNPAKARQLLLEVPILNALQEGDGEALKKLHDRALGFFVVLEDTIDAAKFEWPQGEGEKLVQAARALVKSGVLEHAPPHVKPVIVRGLREGVEKTDSWAPLSCWEQEGFEDLMLLVPDGAMHIYNAYAQAIESADEPTSPEEATGRARGVVNMARLTAEQTSREQIIEHTPVRLPGNLDLFVESVAAVTEQEFVEILTPAATQDQIHDYFENTIQKGEYRLRHLHGLKVIRQHVTNVNWSSLLSGIQDKLSAAKVGPPEEANALVETLLYLREVNSQPITVLAQNGHFAHSLSIAANNKAWDVVGSCIFAQLLAFPDLQSRGGAGQAAQGYERMSAYAGSPPDPLPPRLAELVREYGGADSFLALLQTDSKAIKLVGATISQLIRGPDTPGFVTPEFFADHWQIFPEDELFSLLGRLPKTEELISELSGREFRVGHAPLYLAVLESQLATNEFLDWIRDGLEGVDSEVWEDQLLSGSALYRLARQLHKLGVELHLSGPYRSALKAVAQRSSQGAVETDLAEVAAFLDENQRLVFRDEIAELVMTREGVVDQQFYDAFGSELAESEQLRTNNEVVHKFLEPIVAERDIAGLRWLSHALQEDPTLLSRLDEKRLNVFLSPLREELRDGAEKDDDAYNLARDIAKVLGVRKARRKRKDPEPDEESNS